MPNYENEAREYVAQLDKVTQQRALVAIQDALRDKKSWQWIATALRKKGLNEWQRWGFGLFFNKQFEASVYQQIERDERCEKVDVDSWLRGGSVNKTALKLSASSTNSRQLDVSSPFYDIHAEGLRGVSSSKQSGSEDEDFHF